MASSQAPHGVRLPFANAFSNGGLPDTSPQISKEASQLRSEQIQGDLDNGNYPCVICQETVHVAEGAAVWPCKDCHNIFHYDCIKDWAKSKRGYYFACPQCASMNHLPQVSTCWCGRYSKLTRPEIVDNSCGSACTSRRTCHNGVFACIQICKKNCHSGPCTEIVCRDDCVLKQPGGPPGAQLPLRVPEAVLHRADIPRLDRPAYNGDVPAQNEILEISEIPFVNAEVNRKKRSAAFMLTVLSCASLVAFDIFMMVWNLRRNKWWALPLQYIGFTEHGQESDDFRWFLGFFFFIIASVLLPMGAVMHTLVVAKQAKKRKLVSLAVLTAIALYIFQTLLLVKFHTGVGHAWDGRFRDSCHGFDTRIQLDAPKYINSNITLYDPKSQTRKSSERNGGDTFKFYDAMIDVNKVSSDTFYEFHRMHGNMSKNEILVDFDLEHNAWRIIKPNTSPSQRFNTDTPYSNGTWNEPTSAITYARFPELNLLIPNMYYFTRSCYFEPFMKVYNTVGMSFEHVNKIGSRSWDSFNEKEVVMRTAAFHGGEKHMLEICARRRSYETKVKHKNEKGKTLHEIVESDGLGEDVIVPLGLFAVLRRQMDKNDHDRYPCDPDKLENMKVGTYRSG